ncbi:hypothetical protein [Micromonospora soli]
MVYTTNAIESLNARFRQAARPAAISPMSGPRSRCSTWSFAARGSAELTSPARPVAGNRR